MITSIKDVALVMFSSSKIYSMFLDFNKTIFTLIAVFLLFLSETFDAISNVFDIDAEKNNKKSSKIIEF
ncbi:MAG: hypothetical protein Nk1A_2440 [Endomicrobiia bacterium]|nr:MAG: hypothetical protein Nk1A_2440 [Endomicrobiia bacterium]